MCENNPMHSSEKVDSAGFFSRAFGPACTLPHMHIDAYAPMRIKSSELVKVEEGGL